MEGAEVASQSGMGVADWGDGDTGSRGGVECAADGDSAEAVMAENPNGWNHRALWVLPCGCVEGSTTVEGSSPESLKDAILARLTLGYTVTFCRWDDTDAHQRRCERYPHEPWQIESE